MGGVLLAAWAAFIGSVQDPDYWWHLRIGRWMLDNHRLPDHDIFTYLVAHPWVDHEWLTEVLIAILHRAGGLALVSIVFGAVTWLGLVYIARTAEVGRRPYVIAGLLLALAVLAGSPIWGPRPQMITFCFSAVELFWLKRYLDGRSRMIQLLPLVMALWANLHGGFVVGFLFLGAALGAEALGWLLRHGDIDLRRPHGRRLATLGKVAGASLLALLATPNGVKVYLNPLETLTSSAQRRLIVEWFSPDFHNPVLLPFLAMVLLLPLLFALRRPTPYQAFLCLGTLALAEQSVRHLALFVAAATPVMVELASGAWADHRGRFAFLHDPPTTPLIRVTTVAVLTLIAFAVGLRVTVNLLQQGKVTREQYPVAAADCLAVHPEVGTRMYNQYGWGGYLVNRFYPDPNRRVFVFGEASVMGDRHLQEYQDVQTLRSDWQDVLDRFGVDYIVYNRDEALDNVLVKDPGLGWKRVYADRIAVIYVRQDSPVQPGVCG